jgi:hypothetical protein
MSNHHFRRKLKKIYYRFSRSLQQLLELCLSLSKKLIYDILSLGFIFKRQNERSPETRSKKRVAQSSTAGFILPTVTLVLIIVSVIIFSMLFRTEKRATEIATDRQDSMIYNVATPAIDRAKGKLESLFNSPALPAGVPSEDKIQQFLLDRANNPTDPLDDYTLAGEKRLDINNDGKLDNAWTFDSDLDGDGLPETIAYSIVLLKTKTDSAGIKMKNNAGEFLTFSNLSTKEKANALLSRSGPLTLSGTGATTADCETLDLIPEEGWEAVSSVSVRKNFQVNVVITSKVSEDTNNNGKLDSGEDKNGNGVLDKASAAKVVNAFEYSQDRQMDKGNKFGAWFRNDLEIHPGNTPFLWNGAMHTEGNLMAKNTNFYLVSSPNSCLYTEDASEITMAVYEDYQGKANYQGQAVNADMGASRRYDSDNNKVDIFPGIGQKPGGAKDLDKNDDSMLDSLQPTSTNEPNKIRLDPLAIFTQDENKSQYPNDPEQDSLRDTNWANGDVKKRINNKSVRKPYVDDTYRADDRWGPKPDYTSSLSLSSTAGAENGEAILNQLALTANPTSTSSYIGLDGYWERRARAEGARIIVGPRLNLGNPYGWKDNNESIYPPNDNTLTNLARQRRSLQDRLAAVQAGVVYHHAKKDANGDTDFPVACLALTAHPGTQASYNNSITFNAYPANSGKAYTDFFNGKGTNGWVFDPPGSNATTKVTTASAYATIINDANSPLRIALTNLAYFAGDRDGAFPPRQDTNDNNNSNDAVPSFGPAVHPYPYLTMWGNFSNLRRVINLLDTGTTYSNLSIADKTTLHVASCTLGMIAYNVSVEQQIFNDNIANYTNVPTLQAVADTMWNLVDGLKVNCAANNAQEVFCNPNLVGNDKEGFSKKLTPQQWVTQKYGSGVTYSRAIHGANFYARFSVDDIVSSLEYFGLIQNNQKQTVIDFLASQDLFAKIYGIDNDRRYGFLNSESGTEVNTGTLPAWDPDTQIVTLSSGNLKTLCDPRIFAPIVPGNAPKEETVVGIAISYCNNIGQKNRRFPALYYLFPKYNHDQIGRGNDTTIGTKDDQIFVDEVGTDTNNNGNIDIANEYIKDCYIYNNNNNGRPSNALCPNSAKDAINDNYTYRVIDDLNANGKEDVGESYTKISLQPVAKANWLSSAKIYSETTAGTNINRIIDNTTGGNTSVYTMFLDKGIYDGREMMGVRVLDIDLNLMRKSGAIVGTINEENLNEDINKNDILETILPEYWLPAKGIVYAFREDAVREDGIARPRKNNWTDCNTVDKLTTDANCYMKVNATIPQDPPLNSDTNISPKPVDFYADPDRRPHGFRLRNGQDLTRPNNTTYGLSFVSDQPTYIMGDFNLHSTDGTNTESSRLEEFKQKLTDGWTNFYDRTDLELKFARPTTDKWRPTEIVADATTILSSNFCDGYIANGFPKNSTTADCPNTGGIASYVNGVLVQSSFGTKPWLRVDDSITTTNTFPILVDRNGAVKYDDDNNANTPPIAVSSGNYEAPYTNQRDYIGDATNTRINTVLVGGIVPARKDQSYGGFNNYPRLQEDWSGKNFNLAGAFVQLNFSTYAASPFETEGWEPGQDADTAEILGYYRAGNRLWGYDVGLQYNPPSPVVERFVSSGSPRSEFFQEIEAEDPYINNLFCANIDQNGNATLETGEKATRLNKDKCVPPA